jgi:hypothetical protein
MPRPRVTRVLCTVCEEEFIRLDNHIGFANTCLSCGGEDVPRLMAQVSWENKHTPIIEITDAYTATLFNAKLARKGCTVLNSSIAPVYTEPFQREAGKDYMPKVSENGDKRGTGAEPGGMYHSGLGEKHHLKR